MARKEFSVATKRKIAQRSGGVCEWALYRPAEVCTKAACDFDHKLADGLGGPPTLENGLHLCKAHHKAKSHEHDIPIMRRADNQRDAANGIKRNSRPIPQPPKAEKRPAKPRLPPISLYRDVVAE